MLETQRRIAAVRVDWIAIQTSEGLQSARLAVDRHGR